MKMVSTLSTGGIAITTLAPGADAEAVFAKLQSDFGGLFVSYREMDDSVVPPDRAYRKSWADSSPGLVIDINLTKAKDIHKDILRAARVPLLTALDADYIKADESGDGSLKVQIAAQKQALRDITDHQSIIDAASIESLSALSLEALIEDTDPDAVPTLTEKIAARDADLASNTVDYDGNTYSANDIWISRIARNILKMERSSEDSIAWFTLGGDSVILSYEDMNELFRRAQEKQNERLPI
jgi:hypothetical protein